MCKVSSASSLELIHLEATLHVAASGRQLLLDNCWVTLRRVELLQSRNGVQGGDTTSINGLPSTTIFLTRSCTFFLLRSHGTLVSGSRIVRSKLHPAVRSVPPYRLMAASWAIRGWEYNSTTSAPFRWYMLSASRMMSSTRRSSGTGIGLRRTRSSTSSSMQSSITFPVLRLRTTRR